MKANKSDYDITFEEEEFQLNETIKGLEEVIADIKRDMPSVGLYAVASSWEERDNLSFEKGRKLEFIAQINHFKQFIPSPYYARMDLLVNDRKLTMYIGKKGFSAHGHVVHDWRAPLPSRYRGRETEFIYGGIQYRLALKRDFDISNSTLHYYSDKYVLGTDENKEGITDPFLLRLLIEKKSEHKLTDIIRTIQANQGSIIEFDTDKGFIVQGCAGSGKTMILLHRLSYIKYNHPKLRLEAVKIITPNRTFNAHIDSLSKDLELEDIDIFSVEDYYLHILQKYERRNQSYQKSNYKRRCAFDLMTKEEQSKFSMPEYNERYAAVKVTPEHHQQGFINYVYSDEFKELCIQAYTNYINNIEGIIGFRDCMEICKKYGYAHSFRKDTNNNLDKYIKYITEAFRANTIRIRNEKYNDLLSRKEVLEYKTTRLPNDRHSSAELGAVKHKIRDYESSMLLNKEDEAPVLERAASLLSYRNVYNATINRQLCQAAANFNVDISDMTDSSGVKKCYRYNLYLHLLFWTLFNGTIVDGDRYLHIDEGQDISPNEYEMFRRANGQVIFNIYGDINQLITPGRGVNNWNTLLSLGFAEKVFSLNENYRNSIEITNYCNNSFRFNATPVGTHGANVRCISESTMFNELRQISKSDNRIAFIAKDYSYTDQIERTLSDTESNIFFDTVKSSKGIEYDIVYVLDRDLTLNERYVAYTRALSELIIVE